jgi:lipid-A-disaccharide synthase
MPNADRPRRSILMLAGDVSGDVHAAALGMRLIARDPELTVHALGGKRLREVVEQSNGGEFLADTTNCSAIGILSACQIYLHCRALRDRMWEFLRTHHVDLAILCDWGAFNGRVLPGFHARGIPTLYYFPPRSWQRTGSLGLGIVPFVTRVATPFPWSAERLRSAGAQAEWVGHASLENVPAPEDRPCLREHFGVGPNDKLVALLPGSRPSEIQVLAPRMADTATIASAKLPLTFVAVVPGENAAEARRYLPPSIRIVTDCAKQLLVASDAAVVKTGTGTLEAVICGTPQVAVYDVSMVRRMEWLLLWAWRWVPFIAMPNIILQKHAVPELWGLDCRPETIAARLVEILTDEKIRGAMLDDYRAIHQALGSELPMSPTERTAQIVEEMLSKSDRTADIEPMAA